jgi:hypothetical protein
MAKGEPSAKRTWEGDDAVPVVKEDDAVPVVNQDEVPVDPFGDRGDWAIGGGCFNFFRFYANSKHLRIHEYFFQGEKSMGISFE